MVFENGRHCMVIGHGSVNFWRITEVDTGIQHPMIVRRLRSTLTERV
jgi:hypothetical protein